MKADRLKRDEKREMLACTAKMYEGYWTALHFLLLKRTKGIMRLATGKLWVFEGFV